MKIVLNKLLLLLLYCICFSSVYAQKKVTTQDVNWKEFMSQHDMYWDTIPPDYYSGAIMGNGLLGTNFYKSTQGYQLNIGRVDVTERRGELPNDAYVKVGNLYDNARLPIGYFQIIPNGEVLSEKMHLSLYDAINKGSFETDKGIIEFKSYVHSKENYIVFETITTGGEINFNWVWNPIKAISPRTMARGISHPANYQNYLSNPNPEVEIKEEDGYNLSIQKLFSGITYVVAWREIKKQNHRCFIITVSQEETKEAAVNKAKNTINKGLTTNDIEQEAIHKKWWNEYYPANFISFEDSKMESFYWAQIYKFACATRPDKFIVDLQGPWAIDKTPWPAIWMNLNIQLTYSWMYTGNRSELSEPVWKTLNDNIENLKSNVHEVSWRNDAIGIGRSTSYHMISELNPDLTSSNQYEVGNLTWLLFYYYQYCIYNNKQEELINKFFPLLKMSINYYFYIRQMHIDNKYHLPITASPEYKAAADCNYDLSLLRWGLTTLLDVNEKYDLKDEKKAYWLDFLNNLVDYPIDDIRGYMIGKDVNLTSSHRHYSHLLMIYPLYMVNWEQLQNRNLITKSIDNWMRLKGALQGYSFTGSSSMYSSMGDGERAVMQLQSLLSKYIKPNTLYAETGPVIETPLAAVASLHDLYLQSWGNKIRVFYAVPPSWKKAAFINLRTEGAFLVSATRSEGKTVFIQIESEAGGVCCLQTGMNISNLEVKNLLRENIHYNIIDTSIGLIEINTQKGDIIQISDKDMDVIYPVPIIHLREDVDPFGVRKTNKSNKNK